MNDFESVAFSGQLTAHDMRAVHDTVLRRWQWMLLLGVVVFLVVTVGGGWGIDWRERGLLGTTAYWAPVVIVLFATWFARWMPLRRYAQNKLIQEPCTGTVSETGIDWRTESTHSHPAWDKLQKAKLGDRLVLIYSSPAQVFPFPRSFFASDDEWVRFRALVQRKLPSGRG